MGKLAKVKIEQHEAIIVTSNSSSCRPTYCHCAHGNTKIIRNGRSVKFCQQNQIRSFNENDKSTIFCQITHEVQLTAKKESVIIKRIPKLIKKKARAMSVIRANLLEIRSALEFSQSNLSRLPLNSLPSDGLANKINRKWMMNLIETLIRDISKWK